MHDKRKLARGAGLLLSTWMLVALLVMQTGVATALPLGGIGGFTITATSIDGEGLTQYTSTTDTSARSSYPQGVTVLSSATFTDVQLRKTFDADPVPGLSGNARAVLTTNGETQAEGVTVYTSVIEAQQAEFDGLVMSEQNRDAPEQKFRIQANSISFDNAALRAHYLQADTLDLPAFSLVVQYDPNGDGSYEYST